MMLSHNLDIPTAALFFGVEELDPDWLPDEVSFPVEVELAERKLATTSVPFLQSDGMDAASSLVNLTAAH